jgi:hypothetical protein
MGRSLNKPSPESLLINILGYGGMPGNGPNGLLANRVGAVFARFQAVLGHLCMLGIISEENPSSAHCSLPLAVRGGRVEAARARTLI